MKEGACKVISVITTILFILAGLMSLIVVISGFIDSKKISDTSFFSGNFAYYHYCLPFTG